MDNIRKILVTAECESCDYQFAYDVPITAIAREDYSFYDRDAQKRVSGSTYRYAGTSDDAVTNFVYKCPQCGYIQSWMQGPALKQRRGGVALLLILLTIAASAIGVNFGAMWPDSLLAGLFVFTFVGFIAGLLSMTGLWDFLLRPNKNRAPVDKMRKPHYRV